MSSSHSDREFNGGESSIVHRKSMLSKEIFRIKEEYQSEVGPSPSLFDNEEFKQLMKGPKDGEVNFDEGSLMRKWVIVVMISPFLLRTM